MQIATHGILAASASAAAPSFSNTKSLVFDGVDDFVTMGDVLDMANDGTDAYSISCWYKTTDSGSFQILIAKQKNSSPFNGFSLSMRGDLQRFHFFLGTTSSNARLAGRTGTIATIRDGNWHHVCLTYDGSQAIGGFTLYFDGASQSITTEFNNTPTDVANSVDFNLGCRDNAALFFDGNIDECAYFTSELSASNVTSIYNSGSPADLTSLSPVGWWRNGDGDTFPTLTDNGSGSNNGTMTNMTSGDIVTDVP